MKTIEKLIDNVEYGEKNKKEIKKLMKQILEFATKKSKDKNIKVKDLNKEIIEIFFKQKAKNISKRTLRNYFLYLKKIIEVEPFLSEDELKKIKESVYNIKNKKNEKKLKKYYNNPGAIISNLNNENYIAAYLVLKKGIRLKDIEKIDIKKDFKTKDKKFLLEKGKNLIPIEENIYKEILKFSKNGIFRVNRNKFNTELKNSCIIEGEEYIGEKGIFVNFIIDLFLNEIDEVFDINNGKDADNARKQALKIISQKTGLSEDTIISYL